MVIKKKNIKKQTPKSNLKKATVKTTKVPTVYSHSYKCPHCNHGVKERSRSEKPIGKTRICFDLDCKKEFELDVK